MATESGETTALLGGKSVEDSAKLESGQPEALNFCGYPECSWVCIKAEVA
eukprot:m.195806 g.195806  ORF g.195806 m.195806 type:complete len:50 (+) comp25035_c1_seq1:227-376(+)